MVATQIILICSDCFFLNHNREHNIMLCIDFLELKRVSVLRVNDKAPKLSYIFKYRMLFLKI